MGNNQIEESIEWDKSRSLSCLFHEIFLFYRCFIIKNLIFILIYAFFIRNQFLF